MKLIVLTGLASYSKTQVAEQIPNAAIIDNGEQKPYEAANAVITALDDELSQAITQLSDYETLVLIAAESLNPDALLMSLDSLQEQHDDLEITTIAVIDDRTCACFPHLEEMLRDYADFTLEPPFAIEEFLS